MSWNNKAPSGQSSPPVITAQLEIENLIVNYCPFCRWVGFFFSFFFGLNRTNANKRVLFVLASVIRKDSKNRYIQQLEANMIVFTLGDSRQAAV